MIGNLEARGFDRCEAFNRWVKGPTQLGIKRALNLRSKAINGKASQVGADSVTTSTRGTTSRAVMTTRCQRAAGKITAITPIAQVTGA